MIVVGVTEDQLRDEIAAILTANPTVDDHARVIARGLVDSPRVSFGRVVSLAEFEAMLAAGELHV